MTLNIALLNNLCLVSKYCNKLFSPEVIFIFDTHDIVMFTETWSNESIALNVPNFQHFVYTEKDVNTLIVTLVALIFT